MQMLGIMIWVVSGIISFFWSMSVIVQNLGFVGGLLAFFIFPVTIVFAPFYVGFSTGNWLLLGITYGGGIVAGLLVFLSKRESENNSGDNRINNDSITLGEEKSVVYTDLLPICANCKKIRGVQNNWEEVEFHLGKVYGVEFKRVTCHDCEQIILQGGKSVEYPPPDNPDIAVKNREQICHRCMKIYGHNGSWQKIDEYFEKLLHVRFTHALCPYCADKLGVGLS